VIYVSLLLNWICDRTVYMLWIWQDLVKWLNNPGQELLHHCCRSQDSTVSVVSRLRAGHTRNWGLIPGGCKRFIAFPQLPDLLWGPPSVIFSGTGGCIPLDKKTVAWSWPLTLSVAEVKNEWMSASTPLYDLVCLWEQFCLLYHC